MTKTIKGVAVKLKQLRAHRGMTQEALARKANISTGYIARLEIGRHDPKLTTLRKLAHALNVDVAELLK